MATWSRKRDSHGQSLATQLLRPDNTPVDVSSLTTANINIVITKRGGTTPVINENISRIDSGVDGEISWDPDAGDLDIDEGTYEVEWVVTFASGPEIFPNAGFDILEINPTNNP